jgi:hypothetical protein
MAPSCVSTLDSHRTLSTATRPLHFLPNEQVVAAVDPVADVDKRRQTAAVQAANQTIIVALAVLLLAALAAIAFLYPRASRPLIRPGDALLIAKARRDALVLLHNNAPHDRATFPIVMRLSDRRCVEFRSSRADAAGTYLACYDARTNRKVEERFSIGF